MVCGCDSLFMEANLHSAGCSSAALKAGVVAKSGASSAGESFCSENSKQSMGSAAAVAVSLPAESAQV